MGKVIAKPMGYVKRKAFSEAKIDVKQFEELKKNFLKDIKSIAIR